MTLVEAQIERLENARRTCSDSGIQQLIESWIKDLQKKVDEKM